MNLLCVALLTLILLHGASRGHDDVVKIGAIFTLKTINGRVSKIAIQAAEKDVNSDPRILGGRKLSITIHDSNFSGFLGIIGGMYMYHFLLQLACFILYIFIHSLPNSFQPSSSW